MTTKIVTNITRNPSYFSNYLVNVRWKYASSGVYTTLATNALVYPNGILAVPLLISFDETIDTTINVCATVVDSCDPTEICINYLGTTSTTTTTTL